jgi:colanic acid biosynthesis glycosyl transferase WcaI
MDPTRSMRLGIFSYNFHPEPTGIPAYNTAMARWFVKQGWKIVMHTGIPHYPWWQVHPDYAKRNFRHGRAHEHFDGIEVRRVHHYVPTTPVTGRKRMQLDATWILSTLWDCLSVRHRPDAIIMIAPPFFGGLLGILLKYFWRCPVFYHVQDLQIDAALDLGMIRPSIGKMMLWVELLILRRVDQVTTISDAMRRRLTVKTSLKRPVVLFPNWTDTGAICPLQGPNRFREELGLGANDVLVVYSGNLGRKQALDVLLEAFSQMSPDPHVWFLIAGDGAEREALVILARQLGLMPRLRVMSLVPVDRLSEFLAAGDVHCIPQRRAAADLVLPSKLSNILAAGRAFVATADVHTDLGKVVTRSQAGLLCPPENAAALAAQLSRLVLDADLRQRLGTAGRTYAIQNLAIDQILGRFQRLVMARVRSSMSRHRTLKSTLSISIK